MSKVRLLVAAAGRGSRSGLLYPKTLFPINDRSILSRIFESAEKIVDSFTVISSPSGYAEITSHIESLDVSAEVLVQEQPLGMAQAVCMFRKSRFYFDSDEIVVVWGDAPFIKQSTMEMLLDRQRQDQNNVSVATLYSKNPYTIVSRDKAGNFVELIESREYPELAQVDEGERDIGLFIIKPSVIEQSFDRLDMSKVPVTKEFSFLRLISLLAAEGIKVAAYPIASEREAISFNQLSDLVGSIN